MSKAILVMDMPKNCYECKLQEWLNCKIVKGCHIGETRPDWCPLRPMPEKREADPAIDNDIDWGLAEGWNACIDEMGSNARSE